MSLGGLGLLPPDLTVPGGSCFLNFPFCFAFPATIDDEGSFSFADDDFEVALFHGASQKLQLMDTQKTGKLAWRRIFATDDRLFSMSLHFLHC